MNKNHLHLIKQGAEQWNTHQKNTGENANLANAVLGDIRLYEANLNGADFSNASCSDIQLSYCKLQGSNFNQAFAPESDFRGSDFTGADLRGAKFFNSRFDAAIFKGAQIDAQTDFSSCNMNLCDLSGVSASGVSFGFSSFSAANLAHADFSNTDLTQVNLVHADVEQATFTSARVHGISAWDLKGTPADESQLIITKPDSPVVTVDDLEVAQFVNLILKNAKFRDVIDTVTSKTVLILGRFVEERKEVLDAIREKLKQENYVGVLFDFDPSPHRNLTETVSTLAHLCRFVIADITAARSIPQELTHIVPQLLSVPVKPIVHASDQEWAMFGDLRRYNTILPTYVYTNLDDILDNFEQLIGSVDEWFIQRQVPTSEEKVAQAQAKAQEAEEKYQRLKQELMHRGIEI